MFDTVILGRSCPGKEYDQYEPMLRMKVYEAQQICREKKFPLLIIVSGLESTGRGQVMNKITEWMDEKFLTNHVFWRETDEQRERPLEWRFWRCLPGKGETALFFDGWYGTLLHRYCTGEIGQSEYYSLVNEFKGLEDSLALSGMIIVKLWLHLDKKTYEKRLQQRIDTLNIHHLAPLRKKGAELYDTLVDAAAEAITLTDRTNAPWNIIDAKDENFRNLAVGKAIIDTVNRALGMEIAVQAGLDVLKNEENTPCIGPDKTTPAEESAQAKASAENEASPAPKEDESSEDAAKNTAGAEAGAGAEACTSGPTPGSHVDWLGQPVERKGFLAKIPLNTLEVIDLSKTIDRDVYKKELKALQRELQELTFDAYTKHISSTLLFEGMDAAGKGGTIRRLLGGVDTRIARVIPISSPTDEELAHHYLWRFWRHIPGAGFVTIYDRSWYGRVLVERVEKLTPRPDWSRAYAEINHFEQQLVRNNNILLKFWLHISPDEELRRFREREQTPWKRHKITAEDWRNRGKWDQYIVAADEMFLRTSTAYAPWRIISSEDKKYARIEVLKAWRDALKKAIGKKDDKKNGEEK